MGKNAKNLISRPPVVVVLGHVDHGKTTLLDKIRKTNLVAKEPGEITQHIGAYQVEVLGKTMTFIDTPGHEAFAKMRARGAQVTDLGVLVVAADDGVMPQTLEAISLLQETQVPFIVAINKTDLPTANPARVKKQLSEAGVLAEDLGGNVVTVPISAKTGQGIGELLEMILLLAEMAEISADPKGSLNFSVIEAKLDKGKGPVATVIVQNGTLKVGEEIILAGEKQKVRALIDYRGRHVWEALPGTPVEILGLKKVPPVGEMVILPPKPLPAQKVGRIILKTDTLGSQEAILGKIPAKIEVVEALCGEISGSDVFLAKTLGAKIIGFNLKPTGEVLKLAAQEKVEIKTYQIIYELLDDLEKMTLPEPTPQEEILGRAQILAEFPAKTGGIAGCRILEGELKRGDRVKIVRNKEEVLKGKIKSLRQQKEELPKIKAGKECGVAFDLPLDFQVGDAIIAYRGLKTS